MQTLSIKPVSRPAICLRPNRTTPSRFSAPSRQWNRITATEEPKETASAKSEIEVSEDVKPSEGNADATSEPKVTEKLIGEVEQPERTPLSKGMRDKMMGEYVGLGGAENIRMGQNWFLIISGVVAALAVAAYLSGALSI